MASLMFPDVVISHGGLAARLLLLALVVLVCGLVYWNKRSFDYTLLPPGPDAPWPAAYAYRQFAEWMKTYGPVITIKKGKDVTVIVGDHQAAAEILVKQGASTIDRPHWIAANEILARNTRIVTMSSGPNLRKYRKILHNYLSLKAVKTFAPLQLKAAKTLMFDILAEPHRHQHHAGTYASTLILTLTFGKLTPTSFTDPEVRQTQRSRDRLFAAMKPGAYLVDKYPFLKHVPGYARDLKKIRELELSELNEPVDKVRAAMAADRAPPSLTKYMLENQAEFDLNAEDIMSLSGAMFGAGSYTTAIGISTTVMAAALFPDAQRKVQEELDAVVGRDHPPSFDYENLLPQTEAFMLEVARWRPIVPGGFPHRVSKEVVWKNYRIPAGAIVYGSHWSIGHDPKVFPDPDKFDPQRWFNDRGIIREDLNSFPYGFGRRICPGMHLANRSLWLNTALILWSFEIRQSEPLDSFAFTDELNPAPLPFVVDFKLRHERSAMEAAFKGYGMA